MLAGIPALAQDGATLFKTKCAMCHGDQGQGKPAMNAPKLVGTT
jgi:cytochrome c